MRTKQLMIFLTVALSFMSACTQPNSPEVEEDARGETQDQYELQVKGKVRQNTYGTMDIQAEMLNEPATTSTVTENNVRSLLNDFREPEIDNEILIEKIIYDMPEVTPVRISIIGERVWVLVSFERSLTLEEEKQKKTQIKQELASEYPRYEYDVKIYGATEEREPRG